MNNYEYEFTFVLNLPYQHGVAPLIYNKNKLRVLTFSRVMVKCDFQARRKLSAVKTKAFNSSVSVDWADPVDEPSEEIMAKVGNISFYCFCRSMKFGFSACIALLIFFIFALFWGSVNFSSFGEKNFFL